MKTNPIFRRVLIMLNSIFYLETETNPSILVLHIIHLYCLSISNLPTSSEPRSKRENLTISFSNDHTSQSKHIFNIFLFSIYRRYAVELESLILCTFVWVACLQWSIRLVILGQFCVTICHINCHTRHTTSTSYCETFRR